MTPGIDEQKQALLDQVISILESRLSARRTRLGALYVKYYFRRVPLDDIERDAPATLATIISNQLDFLKVRLPGQMLIRVFNPDMKKDGWESQHTIIEMVNRDSPFLVDTATLTLSEMKLNVHLIIHPVIRFKRDKKGTLTAVLQKTKEGRGKEQGQGQAESVMQFQVDRKTRPQDLEKIDTRLKAAFNDVHKAVSDWRAIEKQVRDATSKMPEWAPGVNIQLIR